ncbi:unnamed protein product [Sphagnum balticum]
MIEAPHGDPQQQLQLQLSAMVPAAGQNCCTIQGINARTLSLSIEQYAVKFHVNRCWRNLPQVQCRPAPDEVAFNYEYVDDTVPGSASTQSYDPFSFDLSAGNVLGGNDDTTGTTSHEPYDSVPAATHTSRSPAARFAETYYNTSRSIPESLWDTSDSTPLPDYRTADSHE